MGADPPKALTVDPRAPMAAPPVQLEAEHIILEGKRLAKANWPCNIKSSRGAQTKLAAALIELLEERVVCNRAATKCQPSGPALLKWCFN